MYLFLDSVPDAWDSVLSDFGWDLVSLPKTGICQLPVQTLPTSSRFLPHRSFLLVLVQSWATSVSASNICPNQDG